VQFEVDDRVGGDVAHLSSGWTEAAVERNRRQRFIWATGPV
jgi:hypothetical protein